MIVFSLVFLGAFLFLLFIGGAIADYIFPHIPLVEKFINHLPDWDE